MPSMALRADEPEWAEPDHGRFGAPYSSPNLGQGGTDPLIRRQHNHNSGTFPKMALEFQLSSI